MSIRRKLSIPMMERAFQQHEKDVDEVLADSAIQHTSMKALDKKNFTQEVRGTRDINNFLEKSEVLLDEQGLVEVVWILPREVVDPIHAR